MTSRRIEDLESRLAEAQQSLSVALARVMRAPHAPHCFPVDVLSTAHHMHIPTMHKNTIQEPFLSGSCPCERLIIAAAAASGHVPTHWPILKGQCADGTST